MAEILVADGGRKKNFQYQAESCVRYIIICQYDEILSMRSDKNGTMTYCKKDINFFFFCCLPTPELSEKTLGLGMEMLICFQRFMSSYNPGVPVSGTSCSTFPIAYSVINASWNVEGGQEGAFSVLVLFSWRR